jgi:hypothetical protein
MFPHADFCKEIISYRFTDASIISIDYLQIISSKIQLSINAIYMFSLIFSKQRSMIDKLRHFTHDIEDKFGLEEHCCLFYVESVHYRHVRSKAAIMCMVRVTSGFLRDANEICGCLGFYAASSGSSLPTIGPSLKMGPIGFPETLVRKYPFTPTKIQKKTPISICVITFLESPFYW